MFTRFVDDILLHSLKYFRCEMFEGVRGRASAFPYMGYLPEIADRIYYVMLSLCSPTGRGSCVETAVLSLSLRERRSFSDITPRPIREHLLYRENYSWYDRISQSARIV